MLPLVYLQQRNVKKNQKLKKLMKLVINDEENFTSSEQLEESQ